MVSMGCKYRDSVLFPLLDPLGNATLQRTVLLRIICLLTVLIVKTLNHFSKNKNSIKFIFPRSFKKLYLVVKRFRRVYIRYVSCYAILHLSVIFCMMCLYIFYTSKQNTGKTMYVFGDLFTFERF